MEAINVTRAARHLSELLNRVACHGASFELTRGGRCVARLVPTQPPQDIRVCDLNALFARLPPLGEDADVFASEVEAIRRDQPGEPDPWD